MQMKKGENNKLSMIRRGNMLIKRKLLQRLMCLEAGQLFFTLPSQLFRQPFVILIDAWEHYRSGFTLHAEGKRNENGETGQQLDRSMIHSSQHFLETPGWWTADECWMLWQMSGGEREPTERSIVLLWPVKNSIIPLSHLQLAPVFQLMRPVNTEK